MKILVVLFLFLPSILFAQKIDSVRFDVSSFPKIKGSFRIFHPNGKAILNLDTSQIIITDQTGRRYSTQFTDCWDMSHSTISLATSVDASGSMGRPEDMGSNSQRAKSNIMNILSFMNLPPNEFAYQVTDDRVLLSVPFSQDKSSLYTELQKLIKGYGNDFSVQLLEPTDGLLNIAKNGRFKRIAAIFTDGIWNDISPIEREEAIRLVRDHQIEFYAFCYSSDAIGPVGIKNTFKILADTSGGKMYDGVTSEGAFIQALKDFQYRAFDYHDCVWEIVVDELCLPYYDLTIEIPEYGVKYSIRIDNPTYKPFSLSDISLDFNYDTVVSSCEALTVPISIKSTRDCPDTLKVFSLTSKGKLVENKLIIPPGESRYLVDCLPTDSVGTFTDEIKIQINGLDTVIYITYTVLPPEHIYSVHGEENDIIADTITIPECDSTQLEYVYKNESCLPQELTFESGIFGAFYYHGKYSTKVAPNSEVTLNFSYKAKNESTGTFKFKIQTGGFLDSLEFQLYGRIIENDFPFSIPDTAFFYKDFCETAIDTTYITNTSCNTKSIWINDSLVTVQPNETIPVLCDSDVVFRWIANDVIITKIMYVQKIYRTDYTDSFKFGKIDFDTVYKCDNALAKLTIYNENCGPITIDFILVDNQKFYIDNSQLVIPGKDSVTLDVVFDPQESQVDESVQVKIFSKDQMSVINYNVIVRDKAFITTDWISVGDNNSWMIKLIPTTSAEVMSYRFKIRSSKDNFEFRSISLTRGKIQYLFITDSTVEGYVTFDEWTTINDSLGFLTIYGQFLLTIDEDVQILVDEFLVNENLPNYVDCVEEVVKPNPDTLRYIDGCGDDILRDYMKKGNMPRARVIPNPVENDVTVVYDKEVPITVYSANGDFLFDSKTNTHIDMSLYSSGTYYVLIKDGSASISLRFVCVR